MNILWGKSERKKDDFETQKDFKKDGKKDAKRGKKDNFQTKK